MAARRFDVLVVGGGIYGLCTAREAALHGLSVALVEKHDFCGATSSNSLKVIHGGLRYLQHLDFKRMRESIRERRTLGKLFPHLVRPMRFVLPCYGHLMQGREVMASALAVNELVSMDRNRGLMPERRLGSGKTLSRRQLNDLIPGLPEDGLTGGAVWFDGQAQNTERMALDLLQGAVEAGASAANYAKVVELLLVNERIDGVIVEDQLSGQSHTLRARLTVNAAGPWVDSLLGLLGPRAPTPQFRMSKALNFVTRQIHADDAVGIPFEPRNDDPGSSEHDGGAERRQHSRPGNKKSHFFIVPWKGYSLIGTRHFSWDGNPNEFRPSRRDVDTFVAEIREAFPSSELERSDVLRVLAGMLPAADEQGRDGVDLQRRYKIVDHAVTDGLDGLVTIVGVKWTTARHVAAEATGVALRKLERSPVKHTDHVALPAGRISDWTELLGTLGRIAGSKYPASLLERLAESHGALAPGLLEEAMRNPELGRVLDGDSPTLAVEIVKALRDEMAQTLSDVIFRRTELGIAAHVEPASLQDAARLCATERAWDPPRTANEIETVGQQLEQSRLGARAGD